MTDVLATIGRRRLLPVVVLHDGGGAPTLAAALVHGGLPVVEVTLRTPAALDAIRVMATNPDLLVGAGTVVRAEQVQAAVDAGARFMVTPGFSRAVVEKCRQLDVLVIPGVATATEVQMAVDAGVEVVKFFPAAAAGGVEVIKAIGAPYPGVRFVPTGGISARNLLQFLAVPQVLAVGGSWMVPSDLLEQDDFAQITELTKQAVALAATC